MTNLIAPILLDYSNYEFDYQEFPQGIDIHFFDQDQESTVRSDYAIRYGSSGLVDLRQNVVLTTADGNVLEAQQLYWNQRGQWLFTDQPYRITFSDGSYNDGSRFDANEDFTIFLSRNNQGVQRIVEPRINPIYMRGKIYKLFEYGYIAMALFSIYLVLTNWSENRERSYMFIIFAVVAVGMYFFKRWFRKNMENRSK